MNRALASRATLFVILAIALALRLQHLMAGVPLAVEIDEPALVDRALDIMRSGNWNPRGFDYPSLVIYLQAVANILQFLRGAMEAKWAALDKYDIASAYEAGRLVTALIGTLTVWLVYRVGKELDSRALGLIAAAQLAVYPMHVRESHFVLTDAPATAMVVATLLLTLRAARLHTASAYAWAAAAAGLAAAAKYNAGVVAIVLPAAWLLYESRAADRWLKAIAIAVCVPLAFLIAVPYAVMDLPAFLSGLGAQMARFSGHTLPTGADAPWRVYLMHLSLAGRHWLPLGALGVALVLWRRRALGMWLMPLLFLAAYYEVLSTHRVVFGRYALPLIPPLCLITAVPIVELWRAWRGSSWARRVPAGAVALAAVIAVITPFTIDTVEWLDGFQRTDTRTLAGRWMLSALPRGTRVVVQSGGPTNLDHLGFDVVERPNHVETVDRYVAEGVDYLVLATYADAIADGYDPEAAAADVLYRVEPKENRWGPLTMIVRLPRRR
jgi:4-amino-4-deoxy-L-arabinose transferase-like glycosyltransferase